MVKEQSEAAIRNAGVRKVARRERHTEESGEALDPSPDKVVGQGLPGEEDKAADGARVSDEAIVSEDPQGQHNPAESEGPLDWKVRNDGLAKQQTCPNGPQET